MSFFYLSFVDRALPEGKQFVGATIVEVKSDGRSRRRGLSIVPENCRSR
jgi:hypothetical protein